MEFAYVSVSVRSLDAAMTFYSSAFGLNEIRSRLDLPEQGIRSAIVGSQSSLTVEFFERVGARERSVRDAADAAATVGWVHLAIRVSDLPQAVDGALRAGASLVSAPAAARRPATWFAYIKDPDGNLIELITSAPASQADDAVRNAAKDRSDI
jgi:catechol 2,3-dioxygenase-like lactoylglutathione lyase family enzyme